MKNPQIAPVLQTLQQPDTWQFLRRVLCDYLYIAAAITMAISASGSAMFVVLYPIAVVVIAARQHALLILMHDATHYLASPNRRTNDWLGELLCAAPLFVTLANYRPNHLAHHRHLNTRNDPDWRRKLDDPLERPLWLFPTPVAPLKLCAKWYVRSIAYLWGTLRDTTVAPPEGADDPTTDLHLRGLILRTRTWAYLGLAIALSFGGGWTAFVLFWLVPTFAVLPLILRVRSIAEHFAIEHNGYLSEARNIVAGPVERFLLAPHHIGLHLTHHLMASVPCYRAPRLHGMLLACDTYAQQAHSNDGYLFGRSTLLHDLYRVHSQRLPGALPGLTAPGMA